MVGKTDGIGIQNLKPLLFRNSTHQQDSLCCNTSSIAFNELSGPSTLTTLAMNKPIRWIAKHTSRPFPSKPIILLGIVAFCLDCPIGKFTRGWIEVYFAEYSANALNVAMGRIPFYGFR